MTSTYRGWSVYRREFVRGLNTEVTQSLTKRGDGARRARGGPTRQRLTRSSYLGSWPSRGGKAATSCLSVLICLWRLQWCYNGGGRSSLRLPCAYMGAVVVLVILCYGGGEPPFIGAVGAMEGRPSPPHLRSPWTWSMIVETIVGAENPPSARTVSLLT